MMGKTLEETAEELAKEHVKVDPEITRILRSRNEKEIRLVEITNSVGTTREIIPFGFEKRPDLGIDFPSVIVLLSPEEFSLLKSNKLKLPKGWGDANDLIPMFPNRTWARNGQKRRKVG